MLKIYFVTFFILLGHCFFGQSLYEYTYSNGTSTSINDLLDLGDNVIACGHQLNTTGASANARNLVLFSINKCSGEINWERRESPSNLRRTFYRSLRPNLTGGFYAIGWYCTSGNTYDNGLIDEFDALGNLVNRYFVDDAVSNDNELYDLLAISPNEFCIVGSSNQSIHPGTFSVFNKVSGTFTTNIARRVGGSRTFFRSVVNTHDNNFLIAGYSTDNAYANDNIVIRKTAQNGNLIWERISQPGTTGFIKPNKIDSIRDGFIISGTTTAFGSGNNDIFVQRIDSLGNSIWFRTYGGPMDDRMVSIDVFNDTIYLAGRTDSYGAGNVDALFLKIDLNGNIAQQFTYGGTGFDDYTAVLIDADTNCFLAGSASFSGAQDPYLTKLNGTNGNTCTSLPVNVLVQNINLPYQIATETNSTALQLSNLILNTYNSNSVKNNHCNFINNEIFGADTVCPFQQNVSYKILYDTNFYDSIRWVLYDGATTLSNLSGDSILVNFNGIADSLAVELFSFCDTILLKKYLFNNNILVNIGNDTNLCDGDSLILDAGVGFTSYLWSTTEITSSIFVTDSGYYNVMASLDGCDYYDTIHVNLINKPIVDLGNDTLLCDNNQLILNPGNFTTYRWQNGSLQPFYAVSNPGTYWVIVNENSCPGSDTINVSYANTPNLNLGPDVNICGYEPYQLSSGQFDSYLWNTGATNSQILVSSTGTYHLTVNANACPASDTVIVNFIPLPNINLGNDTLLLCGDNGLVLTPTTPFPIGYTAQWQDGSSGINYFPNKSGKYWVTLSSDTGNCFVTDSINLVYDCEIYVPNSITLDYNEINDYFKVYTQADLEEFEMLIYDRWGELLYEFEDINDFWDGKHKNEFVKQDVYVWKMVYKRVGESNADKKIIHGHLNVLR